MTQLQESLTFSCSRAPIKSILCSKWLIATERGTIGDERPAAARLPPSDPPRAKRFAIPACRLTSKPIRPAWVNSFAPRSRRRRRFSRLKADRPGTLALLESRNVGAIARMTPELHESRFLRAARREPTDTTPIWIMRQAGRYLPEYRAVRGQVSFLELCKRPDLAAEVTLTAQAVLGVDAAILFADLLPILEPMGFQLEYTQGDGPAIHNPVRGLDDLGRIRELGDVEELGFVFETVRIVRKNLPPNIPLLGFAGAPFTLASYVIEGRGSRDFAKTKRIMYGCRELWDGLMARLADSLIKYLLRQIESGCQAVQIFDSWAGCLSPADYRDYVLPYSQRVF